VRTVWLHKLRVLITAGAIIFFAACTTVAEPTADSGSSPPSQILRDLDELSPGDPSALDEYAAFCRAISIDAGNRTLPSADPLAAEAVLAAYRAALNVAPANILKELAALLDFLEFGIEPDFGEPLETPIFEPSDPLDPPDQTDQEAAADPVTEPTDPFIFISPDADQLALSVAAFLELHCGGVALNPLPPPTVPAAVSSEP
jgi:hypothetical protein